MTERIDLDRNSSAQVGGSMGKSWITAIVAVSAALRLWLAASGGQAFWPDETRFQVSQHAVDHALKGHWHDSFSELFSSADHIGFKILGVVPALLVAKGLPLWIAGAFF